MSFINTISELMQSIIRIVKNCITQLSTAKTTTLRYASHFAVTLLMALIILATGGCGGSTVAPEDLVVYSARKEHLIKPLFDQFTVETGIRVHYVTDEAGPLLARLKAEGEQSQADILMTVDAGNLWQATEQGVLATVESTVLEKNVPSHLRDANNHWFGLTIRARTIVYASDRVKVDELSTYEDLAGQQWAGRLCLRTSKKVYNQSLVALMIAALGEQQTQRVVTAWVNNLALPPLSNDVKVMEAIVAGQCDVGIVNSYYFGRLMRQYPEYHLALYWPNQHGEQAAGRGVHVNVSAAGVTRASRKQDKAVALLEWLSDIKAQQMLMELNQEFAVNPQVKPLPEMAAWGQFKADSINVGEAGRLQVQAIKLMDRAGYH